MCAPTEVGGTHPVIIEAMAAGASLVVSDHAPNLEVVGDAAVSFPLAGGAPALAGRARGPGRGAPAARRPRPPGRRARAAERYSWDACAEAYLRLCRAVTGAGPPQPVVGEGEPEPAISASRGACRSRPDRVGSATVQSTADLGVVPGEAALEVRVVVGRAAVDHVGDLAEHHEAVGEADRDVGQPQDLVVEPVGLPAPERRRPRRMSTTTSRMAPRAQRTSLA